MATLINQGTLIFTPAGGTATTLASNSTATEVTVTYGIDVSHAAAPTTFVNGDTILYTVLLRNTGTGALYDPVITVTPDGPGLDYVEGSASAFLSTDSGTVGLPVTATLGQGALVINTTGVLPPDGIIYVNFNATVTDAAGDTITTTAVGTAKEGSEIGPVISDQDDATITRTPITLTKTAPGTANVGDVIAYTFNLTNNTGAPVALNSLSDQLPEGVAFTEATLTVGGVNVPLTAGTDYTITPTGLFTLAPTGVEIPANGTAVLTINGSVTL